MGWPEYTYLALTVLGLGYVTAKHGQPKEDGYNVVTSLVTTAVVLFLLWWGGFFS